MRGKYFDIERDKQFPCFCQGCLVGKTETEMSQENTRYCLECQPSIEKEYSLLSRQKRRQIEPSNVAHIENGTDKPKTKMSTLNSPSAEVDNFRPTGRPKTYKKRPLPDGKIKQLHKGGMGPKAIATQLKRQQGIDVSYKTIQRVLSGERN